MLLDYFLHFSEIILGLGSKLEWIGARFGRKMVETWRYERHGHNTWPCIKEPAFLFLRRSETQTYSWKTRSCVLYRVNTRPFVKKPAFLFHLMKKAQSYPWETRLCLVYKLRLWRRQGRVLIWHSRGTCQIRYGLY